MTLQTPLTAFLLTWFFSYQGKRVITTITGLAADLGATIASRELFFYRYTFDYPSFRIRHGCDVFGRMFLSRFL
jgi:hypothetical protein